MNILWLSLSTDLLNPPAQSLPPPLPPPPNQPPPQRCTKGFEVFIPRSSLEGGLEATTTYIFDMQVYKTTNIYLAMAISSINDHNREISNHE